MGVWMQARPCWYLVELYMRHRSMPDTREPPSDPNSAQMDLTNDYPSLDS